MFNRRESGENKQFSKIRLSLADPNDILARSHGEVLKPETLNYRSYKPERDGLFCERIFGPVKDYECHCGKYKRTRFKGIICDRCGVEVTEKKVRRERSGHIELSVPVAHIWYFKSQPSKIANLLNIQAKKLETIIYYEKYVVINPGVSTCEYKALLSEDEYEEVLASLPAGNQQLPDDDPDKFIAEMGAPALEKLFSQLDLDSLSYELRNQANTETSVQRKTDCLKRLQIVEAFRESNGVNRPEWMILKIIPVIPPELRPLVPLDGGRFATSDLNELYRRVIIRNNRLKKMREIKAPVVILRNEMRMLQEAVDSLFDNTRRASMVRADSSRPMKSLSDSLKGKRGRFRQNLLGKRVDYSARSVIVVGPELQMHECGLPKEMAAELYKPFIIRKLMTRGIVKTVKAARRVVDRRDAVIYDILEDVIKGHPVLLNRAPTLHRLGIQAFQPKLIEGKAIQLHPLVCTPFNADFDGDQMAVHLPLGNAAVLEAQLLMLGSHNVLNPANGRPVTVPSQDMILGLYYITKERRGAKGEGMCFYGPEEAIIAYNEGVVDQHALVKLYLNGEFIETTVGRIIFNQTMPAGMDFVNTLLTKRSLRVIIADVLAKRGIDRTSQFLDDIKNLGFQMAFKGGLSFNLDDVIIPEEKADIVDRTYKEVDTFTQQYTKGILSNVNRYSNTINAWKRATDDISKALMKRLKEDDQGFNSVYMMLDSGARGSENQIRQLCGLRGLMLKPQRTGASGDDTIENPILSNFKEGLSVLEYFISTHGARKGLADTALKTADAGYLTRRLVDVAQDVIVTEEDCGTLRGLVIGYRKSNMQTVQEARKEYAAKLLGRVSLNDIYDPRTDELIVGAGEELTETVCDRINAAQLQRVEVRSVLTCECEQGVCARCYGRNLATASMVQRGEAVGIIAAQSIGEPGTQLTLRTFHTGGIASGQASESTIVVQNEGRLEFENLKVLENVETKTGICDISLGRFVEMRLIDTATNSVLETYNIPHGAHLFVKDGDTVSPGTKICEWTSWYSPIITEYDGTVVFNSIVPEITCREEIDEQVGFKERVIIESRNKSMTPSISIVDAEGVVLNQYDLVVGTHLSVNDGDVVHRGHMLGTIPRISVGVADITGGLPRVTELFEARNPSDPAIVAEIDGEVEISPTVRRGAREVKVINHALHETKRYTVSLSKQLLVQNGDYVRAGMPLSGGVVTPSDILAVEGPTAVQEYIVREVQKVYQSQSVEINDKHFEVIVRQMMRKVQIMDPGDSRFLENETVDKLDFLQENDNLYDKKYIIDPGASDQFKAGQLVTTRQLKEANSQLKRRDLALIDARDARPATAAQVLQGITRAALQTKSFMSAASFQETTRIINDAAIRAKVDPLEGLKENVICGNLIPAGTGLRSYRNMRAVRVADSVGDVVRARIAAARKSRAGEAALNG